MAVKLLSSAEVVQHVHRSLGLDTTNPDLTTEALAGLLRRAASFHCPTTPRRLVREVERVIQGLPSSGPTSQEELVEVVEALVASGDLYEVTSRDQTSDGAPRELRLGPPRFVRRSTESCLLLGIRPEGLEFLSDDADCVLEHRGHLRIARAAPSSSTPIDELLKAQGIWEIEMSQWLRAPRLSTPEDLVREYDQRLDAAGPSSDIPNVLIAAGPNVTFYRGRWRQPTSADHGRFVARRPQRFGAGVWCYAELERGLAVRAIDLPILETWRRGADEAWRLLAARDALARAPQQARMTGAGPDECRLDLYSPVPSWVQRRLDVTGRPTPRQGGSLMAYVIPTDQIEAEREFLAEAMWVHCQ